MFLEAFWGFVLGWLPQASLGAATLGRPHRQSEHLGPLFPPMLPGSTHSDHTLASDNILFVVPTAHRDLKYRCRRSLMRNRAQEATFKWLQLLWPTGPGSPRRPKPRDIYTGNPPGAHFRMHGVLHGRTPGRTLPGEAGTGHPKIDLKIRTPTLCSKIGQGLPKVSITELLVPKTAPKWTP